MSQVNVITGPTSGIGFETALLLGKSSKVILVGRDRAKLAALKAAIGANAVSVVADMGDLESVRRAAAEIIAMKLPITGLINNAGISPMQSSKSPQGYELSYATNHLGPFVLTEALLPHLPDGANVVFLGSAVEDPDRGPAKMAGFRGARYISAEASARGEWLPGGSKIRASDAYATTKQSTMAAAFALAREYPRLHINVVEPGFNPSTGLARDAPAAVRIVTKILVPLMRPFMKIMTTPKQAAEVVSKAVQSKETGAYFDERAGHMKGSAQLHDPKFQDRVVAETRALLAAVEA